jgi:hypothetical protein
MATSRKVASAYVDLELQIAKFKAALGEADGSMKKFSKQLREENEKSRESVRLLTESIGVGVPRGLQKIIATAPGVTRALNMAFDAVVVIALVKVVYEAGEKIVEFGRKSEEAAKKNIEAWRNLSEPIDSANDKMRITNDRLEEQIAKLEHKPTNELKTAIDEAADHANMLYSALQKANKESEALLESNQTAWYSGFLGKEQTKDITREVVEQDKNVDAAKSSRAAHQQYYGDKIESLGSATAGNKLAREAIATEAMRQYRRDTDSVIGALKTAAKTLTDTYNQVNAWQTDPKGRHGADWTNILTIAGGEAHKYQSQLSAESLDQQNLADTGKLGEDRARKDAITQASEADRKTLEKAKDHLTEMKAVHDMSLEEVIDYWNKMAAAQASNGAKKLMGMEASRTQAELTKQAFAARLQDYFDRTKASLEAESKRIALSAPASLNDTYDAIVKADEESRVAAKKAARITFEGVSEDLKQKEKLAELQNKIDEASGKLSASQAAKQLQSLHDQTNEDYIKAFGAAQNAGAGYDLKTAEAHNGEVDLQRIKDKQDVWNSSFQGGMTSAFDDLIKRSEDFNAQFKDLLMNTVTDVNGAILKLMTTHDDPHPFNAAGKAIFAGVAKTGLEDAEGKVLKLLGFAKNDIQKVFVTNPPEGGAANHLAGAGSSGLLGIVKNIEQKAAHIGGIFGKGGLLDKQAGSVSKNQPNESSIGSYVNAGGQAASKLLIPQSGKASSGRSGDDSSSMMPSSLLAPSTLGPDDFSDIPGRAGGGLMGPGSWYLTGEDGPELLQVGNTSKINNARDTANLMNGGTTHHHHYHIGAIDARGATDPAAVHAAVQRGIMQAAPHIAAATHAAAADKKRRTPRGH